MHALTQALCAQVKAWACAEEFKCCKNDGDLYSWVDTFAYADKFPAPLVRKAHTV